MVIKKKIITFSKTKLGSGMSCSKQYYLRRNKMWTYCISLCYMQILVHFLRIFGICVHLFIYFFFLMYAKSRKIYFH